MAEKKGEDNKDDAKAAEPKPKGKKKLIIIILVVVLLLGGGGGAFLFLGGSKEEGEEHKAEEEAPRVIKQLVMEPFIVNLSEAKSFLKLKVILEYDEGALAKQTHTEEGGGHGGGGAGGGEAEGGAPPELVEKEPIMRDTVIRILSAKTVAEVLTQNGKQQIKDEILEGLNEALEFSEPVFVNLYFMEFIIQ